MNKLDFALTVLTAIAISVAIGYHHWNVLNSPIESVRLAGFAISTGIMVFFSFPLILAALFGTVSGISTQRAIRKAKCRSRLQNYRRLV
jgi:hypothetical protein